MKKRHFLIATSAAASALVVGWALVPPRQRLRGSQPLATAPGQTALNGWVVVGADDLVHIVMPKSEMGQGVHTGLAMLLADELDADWSRVRLAEAPIDAIYNNLASVVDGLPFHPDSDGAVKTLASWLTAKSMREAGTMLTGGSSSIKDLWLPLRQAGASARAMLVAAAARQWGVAAREISVAGGVVAHTPGRAASAAPGAARALRFGALAAAAAREPLPDTDALVLKTPAQFKLVGQALPRIDATEKSTGRAVFAIDVRLPGMLVASVVMCPTLGGGVASFDASKALASRGVKKVFAVPGLQGGSAGVAVLADTAWHALAALRLLSVQWSSALPAARFDSAAAIDGLAQQLDRDDGSAYLNIGDARAALAGAAKIVRAEYRAPYLAHATLEPQNCTVQFADGRATVWAPTQVPGLARRAAALALGIASEQVDVHVTLLGGGFGRRLDVDFIAQAAAIAKEAGGAPVQTFWSREQDTQHDFYRPAAVARLQAGLDAQGALVAWHAVSAGQSVVHQILGRLFGVPPLGPDKTTLEGAFDQPYEWPAARVAHVTALLPMPVGFWRSVGHSHQAFFVESFTDEVAHAAGRDPVAFRAALLQRHPRALHALQRAAALAGWGSAPAPAADGARVAQGIALHQSFGSTVVQIAEVSVAADKTIRVHRVVCVVDCGTPVNPNLIRQQMEGAIGFGLSAALYGGIDVVQGRVQQSNFHDQPLLRMAECPHVDCEIVASTEPPQGIGEPGVPPIAPAVANAVFALTGQRLRTLPLRLA